MPPEIQKLASVLLTNPAKVEVTPVSSTVDAIEQGLFYVGKQDKNKLLIHLLKDPALVSALVFTRTKHGADKVVKVLHHEKHYRCSNTRQQIAKCKTECIEQF